MTIREEIRPFAQAIYRTLSISSLRHLAKETEFVQRLKKLKPEDFMILCSLLHDSVGEDSLQELCGTISYQSRSTISKQALHERFNEKGVSFLKQAFFQLAAKQNWFAIPLESDRLFSRIRIMDATSFRLPNEQPDYPGAQGSGVKVQLEYEWYQGEFLHTSVHQETASDRTAARDVKASLHPGDLCLRDLGFYSSQNLQAIEEQGAFYISRVPANTTFWVWNATKGWRHLDPQKDGNEISPGETIDYGFIRVGSDARNSFNARVIVQRLTKAQRQRRETFLQKKGQKGKYSQSATQRTSIQILITNVTQAYLDAQAIYPMYSIRWQVEILFKTWKSLFEIDHVRAMKQDRLECHLYGTMIRILLASMMAFQCRYYLYRKHDMEGSEYKCIQQAKKAMIPMAAAISSGIVPVIKVIETVYENVRRHGKKEHRNGHVSPFDILHFTYQETFKGAEVS